ncbi:hypothetical protein B1H26_42110 [Amycolatopsis sp. BJA-103]|nr:hypothetical protein BKN51_03340 [Amycolatopsis sp. BJA-103]PNE13158.1 hypothetical protein B1H26_42110 [Amycolatopsis sp. BJA-103]
MVSRGAWHTEDSAFDALAPALRSTQGAMLHARNSGALDDALTAASPRIFGHHFHGTLDHSQARGTSVP